MRSKDFDEEKILQKPLILHLATICDEGPRSSPLWFLYENKKVWLFGAADDSFVKRLKTEPKCALTVVDFDSNAGVLLHVGIRGFASLHKVNQKRLNRFIAKYIGKDTQSWNKWFIENIVKPLDVMIEIDSHSVVAKDVSFFRTGPNLASKKWL